MKILQLTAEHIKRLSVVEITPTGSLVVIAGQNEAGKSTVLDAIMMALAGAAAIPPEPVTRGQKKGTIRLDLGDYVVTRTITSTGGGTLRVQNREGATYPSPQAMLDGLVGRVALDPCAFLAQKPTEQRATLMALAGINTDDLDIERKRIYDERTLSSRALANAKGALASAVRHPEVGLEPESGAEWIGKLAEADELAAAAAGAQRNVDKAERALENEKAYVATMQAEVQRMETVLAQMRGAVNMALENVTARESDHVQALHVWGQAEAAVPDRTQLRAALQGIEARNALVADNQRYAGFVTAFNDAQGEVDNLTASLNDLDTTKHHRLSSAVLPVQGLGLSEGGVTWQDLPFEQASSAIRLRVSVAIGLALQPKLKVLIVRSGNDLDENNLRLLAEIAEETGSQVWLERIAGADGQQTILIEAGAVKAPKPEPAPVP
jgi:energy-coupling factor transporter ATP-binding protein EcfA2